MVDAEGKSGTVAGLPAMSGNTKLQRRDVGHPAPGLSVCFDAVEENGILAGEGHLVSAR
jgi:hypothetical protein